MAKNNQKWLNMARNGWMWLELAGNALYWSEIVWSGKKWSSEVGEVVMVTRRGHRWPKMAKNSQKMAEKWPEMAGCNRK